jgi:flagellum-specific ATP synthase
MQFNLRRLYPRIQEADLFKKLGRVTDVTTQLIQGHLPDAKIGSLCRVSTGLHTEPCLAEVVGLKSGKVLLIPYTKITGVSIGNQIELRRQSDECVVGDELIGRVIDGMGQPIDQLGDLKCRFHRPLWKTATNPLERRPIDQPLDLGVRAVNSFSTIGRGQRVSIMAGSGVGKSVLMGMMARSTEADVNVIAMIGERGREVKEFIQDILGEEGLKKSIVVAVTSDQSPLLRMRGAQLATTIAEYFSEKGQQVLLIMDSLTRFAMAQREISLLSGEPPAMKGYTASLYPTLSRLLERAGNFESGGSITGIYTVLVEGDDMDDPVADTVRSIVDGHIVLTRKLAQQGHFPSIDILQSLSRVMDKVVSPDHLHAARKLKRKMAIYKDAEDLINVGAYKKGINPEIDEAVSCFAELNRFLRQSLEHKYSFPETISELQSIAMRYSGDER